MKIKYQTLDGKLFDTEEKAIKYEQELIKIKTYFDSNFFPNYKVNYKINSVSHNNAHLGNPRKTDWSYINKGYTLHYGRMGNGDCRIRFKLRGNNLLILKYWTDEPEIIYLGKVNMNDIIMKIDADKYNV